MTAKPSEPIHVMRFEASMLARQCHEFVEALIGLIGSRRDNGLSGDEWMSLLTPVAEQLHVLQQMLEHDVEIAESLLFAKERRPA